MQQCGDEGIAHMYVNSAAICDDEGIAHKHVNSAAICERSGDEGIAHMYVPVHLIPAAAKLSQL